MIHAYKRVYQNVMVRQLDEKDIEQLRLWRNDSSNTAFLRQIPEISRSQQMKWFNNYLNNSNEIVFAIEEIKKRQLLVGSASLYNLENTSAEFGKFLIGRKGVHGEKIGFNSLKAILSIAFNELELNYVILHCFEKNKAAMHVYQQAGFVNTDISNDANGNIEYKMRITKEKFRKEEKNNE